MINPLTYEEYCKAMSLNIDERASRDEYGAYCLGYIHGKQSEEEI